MNGYTRLWAVGMVLGGCLAVGASMVVVVGHCRIVRQPRS